MIKFLHKRTEYEELSSGLSYFISEDKNKWSVLLRIFGPRHSFDSFSSTYSKFAVFSLRHRWFRLIYYFSIVFYIAWRNHLIASVDWRWNFKNYSIGFGRRFRTGKEFLKYKIDFSEPVFNFYEPFPIKEEGEEVKILTLSIN